MPCRLVEEYEPFDIIEKGDVILLNGKPRTVRKVSRSKEDAVRAIYVAILRRSWTNRPYTVIGRSQLKRGAYKFGGVIARRKDKTLCATEIECLVQKEIEEDDPYTRYIRANKMTGLIW